MFWWGMSSAGLERAVPHDGPSQCYLPHTSTMYVRASQHEEANFALVLFSVNNCSVRRVMKSVEGDVLMIPYTTQA
jgi:hypothetical protein